MKSISSHLPLLLLIATPLITAHHHPSPPRAHLHHARSICTARSLDTDLHCLLAHEATEGPFYIPQPLLRFNITEDRAGVPFTLRINVVDATTCSPPSKAVYVDLWHADATGEYSGWATEAEGGAAIPTLQQTQRLFPPYDEQQEEGEEEEETDDYLLKRRGNPPPGGPPPGGPSSRTPREDSRWLRGVQKTDSDGVVTFRTVWPGWYAGRATHMHVRVHTGDASVEDGMLLDAGRIAHTGQFFFADKMVAKIRETREPYKSRRGEEPTWNGDDGIYVQSDGADQIVDVVEEGDGFLGTVTLGVDPAASHEGDEGEPGFGDGHIKGCGVTLVISLLLAGVVVSTGLNVLLKRSRAKRAGVITLQ